MYLYISVMVASESLKTTGGGEGSQSVYTSRAKYMEMKEALRHQQCTLYVYSRDSHPSEEVNTIYEARRTWTPCS